MYISYTQTDASHPAGLCDHAWDFGHMDGEPYSVLSIDNVHIRPMMEAALAEARQRYAAGHNCSTVAQEVLIAGMPDRPIARPTFLGLPTVCTPHDLLRRVKAALPAGTSEVPSTAGTIPAILGDFRVRPWDMRVVLPTRRGREFCFAATHPVHEEARAPIVSLAERVAPVAASAAVLAPAGRPRRLAGLSVATRTPWSASSAESDPHRVIRDVSKAVQGHMGEVKGKILADAAERERRRSTYEPSMMLGSGTSTAGAARDDEEEGWHP
jgi:hypothetical protein